MKNRKVCLLLVYIFILNFNFSLEDYNVISQRKEICDDKIHLKKSGYWNLAGSPIFINDSDPNYNWIKTVTDNDWCAGSGTWSDPYIIQNVRIDGLNSSNCIEIKNSKTSYFIIKNCTVFNSSEKNYNEDAGIKLYNTTKGLIINNNCSNNNKGICLYYSDNNTILENIVNSNNCEKFANFEDGIFLYQSNNNTISGNVANNNYMGINIYGGNFNLVLKNKLINNSQYGIALNKAGYSGKYNTISENVIINNSIGIIVMNGCYNNTVSKNNISGGLNGIEFYLCDNSYILENSITKMDTPGLRIMHSKHNFIFKNNVYNCSIGISLMDSSNNNNISENIIYNTTIGIDIGTSAFELCSQNLISNNIMENNSNGIYLDNTDNNTVLGNTINNNYINGIRLWWSNYNTVLENIINNNGKLGIYLWKSDNNTISGNTLINNHEGCLEESNCEGNAIENNYCVGPGGIIPSYDIIFLFCIIGVVSVILIKRRYKY